MSVVIETTVGDLTVDLYLKERPKTCLNFLKLCKNKAYNCSLFHTVQPGFVAQTGDPTGKGRGGESIFAQLYGEQAKYFESEVTPRIKHTRPGLVSMVNCGTVGEEGSSMLGSQFFITLGEDIEYLDAEHCVFGEVVEWEEIVEKFNGVITDRENRPYQDVRITHTVILHDPYDDPPGLELREDSPEPTKELLAESRIGADENINDYEGMTEAEMNEVIAEKEAKARAAILTIVGDLPDEDVAPPENVLFVCKLNPVTCDDDLEIIFGRFGKVIQCEVIRDRVSGESLQYAFVEFEDREACEKAYFKMDNVLIDDRRIHVDFSQSVSRFRWKGKGRLEYVAGQKQSFKESSRPVKTEGKGEDLKEVIERERKEKKRDPERRDRDRREEKGRRRSRSRERRERSRSRDRKQRRSRSRERRRSRSRERKRSRSREKKRSRSRERKRSRSKEKRKGGSDQFGRRVRRRSGGSSSGSD